MTTIRLRTSYGLVFFAALLLLPACASSRDPSGLSADPALTASASTEIGELQIKPGLAEGFYARDFGTVEEMAAVNVIFGRVVAERDGDEAQGGEFDDAARQVRRIITVEVLDQLSGNASLKMLEIRTLGWIYEDGDKKPFTFSGESWLQVGDEALMAVDDANNPGDYGFASNAGVHLIRNNRIVGSPGNAPKLNRALVGMTREEVKRAFTEIRGGA